MESGRLQLRMPLAKMSAPNSTDSPHLWSTMTTLGSLVGAAGVVVEVVEGVVVVVVMVVEDVVVEDVVGGGADGMIRH